METIINRYFIEIAYKGTNYHGWQIQQNAISIQEVLNKTLSTVFRQEVYTLGCGRTDTGVHAKQLFAHFDLTFSTLKEAENIEASNSKLLRGINSLLPIDIAANRFFKVKKDAHARFDALHRTYEYHIHYGKNPFLTDYSWRVRDELDKVKMNEAAKIMMEYQDFSCFSKSNTQVFTNNCVISLAEWNETQDGRLVFVIQANRFLRNMVRAIVGTLVEIGSGNQDVEHIRTVLESKDRSIAGVSVPACGLYLVQVVYPAEIIKTKHKL